MFAGYISSGIEQDSENHTKALELLTAYSLPPNTLVQHELKAGHVRLPVINANQIGSLYLNKNMPDGKTMRIPLTDSQKNALESVYQLSSNDATLKQEIISKFMEELKKRNNLAKFQNWWDNIPMPFSITSVGRVLAHANAQRCDKNIPPMPTITTNCPPVNTGVSRP